jgi:DNA topoisomerase-1
MYVYNLYYLFVIIKIVQSQEARVIIDRLLGFEISKLLIKYTSDKNVSAGRVMSVAMKLILEKEKEIINFLSSRYYKISGNH